MAEFAPQWRITEKQFHAWLSKAAKVYGWRIYHTWNSFRSTEGFPDCVLLRGGRLIVAELKSDTGKVRENQQAWLDAFKEVPHCETYLWRPADMDRIAEILR